jgi:hypothetical protein
MGYKWPKIEKHHGISFKWIIISCIEKVSMHIILKSFIWWWFTLQILFQHYYDLLFEFKIFILFLHEKLHFTISKVHYESIIIFEFIHIFYYGSL